ncbi:MAG: alpha-glucosidase family protein [Rhodoferax sp.]
MTNDNNAALWWKGAVIYQIYPRSFADANGDGVGDLRGIAERLDYVASLGVDAIWLSPIFRSPMRDFGYDVSDYRDIDPLFGTLQDFDALVQRAHALGLKVLIDQVLSHTSDQHPWFQQSRASRSGERADWYVWADAQADGTPPNNWRSVFGGSSWTWDTRRKQYYLHNFLSAQPDLNFHTPAVQDQLLQDMEFWLRRGVDGFRLDTTNYFHHDALLRDNPAQDLVYTAQNLPANPYDMQQHLFDKNRPENLGFLERVRTLLDRFGAASVGEVGDAQALQTMIDYTSGDKRLHITYSFSFLNRERQACQVRRHALEFEQAAADKGSWPCWTFGNHDSARVMTRWEGGQDPAFVRLCMAALFSLRGSACWYQGDEWALPEADLPFEALQDPPGIAMWPEYKGRDGCRTPMPWQHALPDAGFSGGAPVRPWLPVPAEHRALALDRQEADPNAPLHFMRAFLDWRRQQRVLRTGAVQFLPEHAQVLAFVRTLDGAAPGLLCAFNFTPERAEIALPAAPGYEAVPVPGLPATQCGAVQGATLVLPPWGLAYLWMKG